MLVVLIVGSHSILYPCRGSFFFQAEDGIRDLVRSRGLGDVYKRQDQMTYVTAAVLGLSYLASGDTDQARSLFDKALALSLIHI